MEELIEFTSRLKVHDFPVLMFLLKGLLLLLIVVALFVLIYDRYIQRDDQLLINFPLIGRMRYFFYLIRDPMRQYFGDENFFDSFEKVQWVYRAAQNKPNVTSYSPGQRLKNPRFMIKNANTVLNPQEVDAVFSVRFGGHSTESFTARSVVGRSGMSDGAISPEGTRAFAKGAFIGRFPINTGEGSLTTNFISTHRYRPGSDSYLEVKEGTWFAKAVYGLFSRFFNKELAENVYRHLVVYAKDEDSYLFDKDHLVCYRINWQAPLDTFPKSVPDDLPDIIFQMGSALYGVRDKEGRFDEERYRKVMRFCKMTEVKIAQGAKQTGGKLLANKISDSIAYYRGVEAHKDLISPNRFPYANTLEELFDFIGRLKKLSNKPVGAKIVLSSRESFEAYTQLIKARISEGSSSYPDFLTLDGADGGSGAAPLEMMTGVGMSVTTALYIADTSLREAGVRENVRLIASEKVLTPDDAVVLLGMGADYVAIARAFMMSAGCIRARECSGAYGRHCPVGLATQDPRKRASFLVEQKSRHVANYHRNMISGIRGLLAIMGLRGIGDLGKEHLSFKDESGATYADVDRYFQELIIHS
jgi:glutamate synthase domain-containing protein 2